MSGKSTLNKSYGGSDYHKMKIQPWVIWSAYELNPWRADIVKRVLRDKDWQLDLIKIRHIAQYLIENPLDDLSGARSYITAKDIVIANKLNDVRASILEVVLNHDADLNKIVEICNVNIDM